MYGIGAVGGMALGKLYVVETDAYFVSPTCVEDTKSECTRFLESVEIAVRQLTDIQYLIRRSIGERYAEIFEFQLLVISDQEYLKKVLDRINKKHMNAEYAVDNVTNEYLQSFKNIDNVYLRERIFDIEDLATRLNHVLRGKEMTLLTKINDEVIVAAKSLTPSQMAGINKENVKGILLERGEKFSHSVMIARAMEIPCISNLLALLEKVGHGDLALINGDSGEVVISPSSSQVEAFRTYKRS